MDYEREAKESIQKAHYDNDDDDDDDIIKSCYDVLFGWFVT